MLNFLVLSDAVSCCLPKIEYMVVSFDTAEKNAKLSLRQTEILAKLNTIVGNICAGCPEEYLLHLSMLPPI
jgi:hypothetical protein